MKTYTTSGLAKEAGVGIHTVRYYIRRGLLNPTSQRPSGYGVFTEQDVQRLRLIVDAKSRGQTLGAIEKMQRMLRDSSTACRQIVEFYRDKVEELDRRIQELTETRDRLVRGIEKCGAAAEGQRCEELVVQMNIVNNGAHGAAGTPPTHGASE